MIISQTPFRISFLGGGTDYPDYYRAHGGATLAATIDQYTLVTVQPLAQFSEHGIKVQYSQLEAVDSVDEIRHPSARECLKLLGIEGGIEIHYLSDLPARTGLGSSSSATVGLLHALHAYKGEMVSREQLAREAVVVEQEMIPERVGSQDQYACALGGLRAFEFARDGTVRTTPLPLDAARARHLQQRMLLFYTGVRRHAHEVLDEQLERTRSGSNDDALARMKQLVEQGIAVLSRGGEPAEFGTLLHESWLLKRGLSNKISNPAIDGAYARALAAGAIGGKLLGAGGGGFLLLFVEPEFQGAVAAAIPELRQATFGFENRGSEIIFYRP